MDFQTFKNLAEKPHGKTSSEWSSFPLMFGDHEELLVEVDDFSVVDDFLVDHDLDGMAEDFSDEWPDYIIIAICDLEFATEKMPDFTYDSYAEFFIVVDTGEEANPVLLWTGESQFEPLTDSFELFYDSLRDWTAEDA